MDLLLMVIGIIIFFLGFNLLSIRTRDKWLADDFIKQHVISLSKVTPSECELIFEERGIGGRCEPYLRRYLRTNSGQYLVYSLFWVFGRIPSSDLSFIDETELKERLARHNLKLYERVFGEMKKI